MKMIVLIIKIIYNGWFYYPLDIGSKEKNQHIG
jgi:hypothetical protein